MAMEWAEMGLGRVETPAATPTCHDRIDNLAPIREFALSATTEAVGSCSRFRSGMGQCGRDWMGPDRADQALIAAIIGPEPRMLMARVRL
jgi:hypothetical protein